MKRVTIRQCVDGDWSATYEEAQEKFVLPLDFAVGRTQLEASQALMERCPDSRSVPAANIAVVRLKQAAE